VAVPPELLPKNHPAPNTSNILPEESIPRLLTVTSQGNRPRQFWLEVTVITYPLPLNTMFDPTFLALLVYPPDKFKLRVRLYVVLATSMPLNDASTLTGALVVVVVVVIHYIDI
jgi:hypothetical protein